MSEMTSWQDTKAKARQVDAGWDSPARLESRAQVREELLARVNDERLAEITGPQLDIT